MASDGTFYSFGRFQKLYGEGEIRVGGVDAGTYLYTRDHLGSVREVMKLDGTLQARYDYDAYGRRMTITQNPNYLGGCDFGYTGHFTRTALVAGRTELVLTHFRVYDAELGRWLSEDPLGESANAMGNLYAYGVGNPLSGRDPLGLYFGWDDAAFVIGGALIGVASQGVSDLISGELSGWEDYAGAAVGGAVGGAVLLYTAGNAYAAGAAAGAVTNLSKQGLKMATGKQDCFDLQSLVVDTGVGTLTGIVPGARISGVTAGRGSMAATFRGLSTKAAKGNLGWIDKNAKNGFRMAAGALADTAAVEASFSATAGMAFANKLTETQDESSGNLCN